MKFKNISIEVIDRMRWRKQSNYGNWERNTENETRACGKVQNRIDSANLSAPALWSMAK